MGHNGKRQLPTGITGNLLKAARFAANFKTAAALAKAAELDPNVIAMMEATHEKEMRCTRQVLSKILAALTERGVKLELSPTTNQTTIVYEKKMEAPLPNDGVVAFPMLAYNAREHANDSWCFIHGWKMSRREVVVQGPIDTPDLSITRTIEFFKYHVHYKRKTLFVPLMYAHDHRSGEMEIVYMDMAGNLLRRKAVEWVTTIIDNESSYVGRPYINTGRDAVVPQLQNAFYGAMASILATSKPKSEIIAETLESVGIPQEKKDV